MLLSFYLQVLWLIVRFFLLATEISVITFALAFGKCHSVNDYTLTLMTLNKNADILMCWEPCLRCLGHLERWTSMRLVLVCTFSAAFVYSSVQVCEFNYFLLYYVASVHKILISDMPAILVLYAIY